MRCCPDDLRGLGSSLVGVHVLCGDPRRIEGVPLVGHEREERHHQHRQPVLQQRGHLVATALAEARREHDEHVPLVEGGVDRLLLLGAERRRAKHARILLGKPRAPRKVRSAVARVEHVRGLLLRRRRQLRARAAGRARFGRRLLRGRRCGWRWRGRGRRLFSLRRIRWELCQGDGGRSGRRRVAIVASPHARHVGPAAVGALPIAREAGHPAVLKIGAPS